MVAASVGVDDAASGLSLSTAQPSPFHGTTRLAFTLPKPGPARLEVVDLQGRRVATLMQGSLDAGFHQVVWFGRGDNGQNVRGGVYFVRLQAQGRTLVERVTKLD